MDISYGWILRKSANSVSLKTEKSSRLNHYLVSGLTHLCLDWIYICISFHKTVNRAGWSQLCSSNSISLCHLLITFANSLDPDQARQNVWPNLVRICLTLRSGMVLLKEFFEKIDFEKKNQQTTKKHEMFPRMQRIKNDMVSKLETEGPRVRASPASLRCGP